MVDPLAVSYVSIERLRVGGDLLQGSILRCCAQNDAIKPLPICGSRALEISVVTKVSGIPSNMEYWGPLGAVD
jgi:hypothetical protein